MNGISSPIRSPQLRTRNDFFVAISMIIEGAGGAPVTTDDSIDTTASASVDPSKAEMRVVGFVVLSLSSDALFSLIVDEDVGALSPLVVETLGVVLRRVNRILFVLETLSTLSVDDEIPSDSQAKAEGCGNKRKLVNLFCFYDAAPRLMMLHGEDNAKVASNDVSECLSKYLSSQ